MDLGDLGGLGSGSVWVDGIVGRDERVVGQVRSCGGMDGRLSGWEGVEGGNGCSCREELGLWGGGIGWM